ncbi:MAG: serine protein kinase PrkA [Myxococcales bacterium]|nr:serine protein kinase PrkA [Myxococcales bacterium]
MSAPGEHDESPSDARPAVGGDAPEGRSASLEALLDDTYARTRERFEQERRVLSFDAYLDLCAREPRRSVRDAATYARDALDHFGSYEVTRPTGVTRRYRLFDLAFDGGSDGAPQAERGRDGHADDRDRLIGHEELQESFRRALEGFIREGRVNRMVMLHGPNGSAKSTFVACLMRGLEAYSRVAEGALYRFAWVFPKTGDQTGIGFSAGAPGGRGEHQSFALLPESRIAVKLTSELKDHPLLLLPRAERRALLAQVLPPDAPLPAFLAAGELSHKNKQIFDALLTDYRGDLRRVFAHVQVERFDISRRYRSGAVTIGPAMSVDASERQITADRSLASLPASLSALTLFESYGPLVDGAAGIVEFSDLLKRPLDAWRYLLLAIEEGSVPLSFSTMTLNALLVASSNEFHLAAFREHHDYGSFRGRMLPIVVPYLRDYRQEQAIYDTQIVPNVSVPVAPHTTYVAALWAVLTRLRRPEQAAYDDATLGAIAASLSPLEKAELYADGSVPERLEQDEQLALRSGLADVYAESLVGTSEGLLGASAREVRSVLLEVAADSRASCLAPPAVLARLETLCAEGDYDFLRLDVDGGYHDALAFVDVVRERWLDRVDLELRTATGLVSEERYMDLFARYVAQVSHAVKGERWLNPVTQAYEDPDTELLESVEATLEVTDPEEFRATVLGGLAAWAIDQPDRTADLPREVDYRALFPRQLAKLESAYFESRRAQIARVGRSVVALLDGESARLEPADALAAESAWGQLRERGYSEDSGRIALAELLAARY